MYFKRKYFIFFIVLLVALMGLASAADADDYTQTQTSYTSTGSMATDTHENIEANINNEDTYTLKKCNVPLTNENNNIKSQNNSLNNQEQNNNFETDTTLLQKKSSEKVKTESNENVTTITEDNYNDYLSISSSGKATLNRNYFVAGKNYTINFTYFPSDANKFEVNFYSNSYKNDNLKIIGNGITIKDTNFIINKNNFNSIVLEDMVLDYSPDYRGDYVNVSSVTLNGITINVDTQREIFSIPLTVRGEKSLVENCTVNANVPSTQIDWYTPDIPRMPKGVGVWITSNNVTLANNVINVNESKVETGNESYYRSLYGIYSSGSYTTLRNNTFLLNGTQYSYGIVVRSLNNLICDNNITVVSEYYAAGINVEGEGISNNLMCNNYVNVSAGFGVTDQGNPDVAYACLILDFSCGGENYVASYRSMCNNSYINNTVICDGRQVYGFELWGGVNTTISGNNLTVTGTLPLCIGAIGINTTMENNIIFAEGTSNSTEGSADYIKPRTAGIYAFGMKEGNSIKNNTIAVTNGRALRFESTKNMLVENNFLLSEDYAYVIEVDNINNTFKYNAIIGEGTTDEVIKDTNRTDNTYINNREPTNSTLTITAPDDILLDEEINITVSLMDEEDNFIPNQYITVQVGNEEAQTLLTDGEGKCVIPYTMSTKDVQVNAEYECYQDYGCSATKLINTIKPIILTPESFDTYITDGLLNDNVPTGSYIDVQGKFDGEIYAFNITKPVNIYSSTGDAFFSFYSTATSESGSELPHNSFVIASGGSGTNVTGIYFENTEILVLSASDVTLDNLTVYCTEGYGWGRGSTSIRNSNHVTIKNSYFNTTDNNGVSTVVFAASQNSLIENCTVCGSGFVGNLVYATTYNVEVHDQYGNNNITVRGNRIIARDLVPGIATCYSVCLIGDNLTVENNYIENSNRYLIMTQYRDEAYVVEGDTGSLIIRNNSFATGKIGIKFDPCLIENNTFYGNVTLEVTNNTVTDNNVEKDASENPYACMNTAQYHDAVITVSAPEKYYYYDEVNVNLTLVDENSNPITCGRLEVYIEGVPYENITVNASQMTYKYSNESLGTHRLRFWYYTPDGELSNSQKLVILEAVPITGNLILTTNPDIHIGDTITLNVTYSLEKDVPVDVNITFNLPGQSAITLPAVNNGVSLETTITNSYIRDIMGGREQSVKITATTNDTNVVINEINTKLGVQKAITKITITPETTTINMPTTITASIETPSNLTINTGSITFTANGETITTVNVKNNKVTTTITFNTSEEVQITATYSGTTYYEANTTTININVEKEDLILTLNPIAEVVYGHNVIITGKLTDKKQNKIINTSIKITINGRNLTTRTDTNGEFTATSKVGSVGINNVTASYAGDNNYNPTSTNTTYIMIKQDLIITVNPIATTGYGDNITVSGRFVDGDGNARAKNELKININGKSITTTTDTEGYYSLTTNMGKLGTNNVTVSHSGGANYNPAEITTTYEIVKQDLIITLDNLGTVTYGSVTITGRLTDGLGNPRANTGVKLLINGKSATAKTDSQGYFSFTTKAVKVGVNNITASHNGGGNYNPTSTNNTFIMVKKDLIITVDPIATVTYGDSVTITGTFTDGDGNIRANSNLKVIINGKTLTAKTDVNGRFTATSKVGSVGINNVTVAHSGGTGFNPTSTNTTFTMIKQNLTININPISSVKLGSSVTITGNFTDANGKIRANTNLKISINGKESTTKTNSNGVFTYTTTATTKGTNNVTVSHAGGTNYNPSKSTTKFTVTA